MKEKIKREYKLECLIYHLSDLIVFQHKHELSDPQLLQLLKDYILEEVYSWEEDQMTEIKVGQIWYDKKFKTFYKIISLPKERLIALYFDDREEQIFGTSIRDKETFLKFNYTLIDEAKSKEGKLLNWETGEWG